jgi:glycosyltransferase involved in cell wall biosynthesis
MPAPRVSVVIVTCNRRHTLELCLTMLARQSLGPGALEALVIDDGSTDGTPASLIRGSWPFRLTALTTGNPAEVFGVMRGRNIGLLHARGELALFLDDDMILHPDALREMTAAHDRWAARGGTVAVRGWFGQRRKKGPLRLWLRALTLSRYRPVRERRRNEKFQALDAAHDDLDVRQAPIGMLSVPLQAARRVDGFPEQGAVYGMDYEFQSRLKALAGVRFVFEPKAYALHGPLPGDMTNVAYRRPLQAPPSGPRIGLSAYVGIDPARFILRSDGTAPPPPPGAGATPRPAAAGPDARTGAGR